MPTSRMRLRGKRQSDVLGRSPAEKLLLKRHRPKGRQPIKQRRRRRRLKLQR